MHPPEADAPRHRILVVDDDEMVLQGLSASLERDGYRVSVQRSGDAAVQRLSRDRFDLVITDVMMPGLSGIGVLERVRAMSPDTNVVVLSGYPRRDLAEEAMRKGADEFLVKPVNTSIDSSHCGQCNSAWANEQVCSSGSCTL